jgi:HD-like signal output (HDOD) protein
VQKVLEDSRVEPAQIAQIIAADAALAARILRLANSAFMNPSGYQVKDLKRAIAQLGHQLVRCSAVSFALRQMELDGGNAELRSRLQEFWRKGMLVASIAYVLARETRGASPDEALVTGLMHNIGRLYITVSFPDEPRDSGDDAWADVVNEWHPRIAHAILKHWGFPTQIVAAVGAQNSWERETQGGDALTDILIAATALVPCVFSREYLDDTVTAVPPFRRLGLDAARCQRLMADSAQQIRSLQAALSG